MITINKQLVVANSQSYKCENITMQKANGVWTASVSFGIYSETGERVDQTVISYEASQWNAFWANFNNGTFLYDQLVTIQNLDVVVLDSENDFTNA